MLQKVINGNTALDKDPMDSELAQMLEFAKEKEMNYRKRDVKGYQKKYADIKGQINDTKQRQKAVKKRIKELTKDLIENHDYKANKSSSSSESD